MKKFLLMMALCLLAVGAQAAKPKEVIAVNGTITYRDGHEETHNYVYFPSMWSQKIYVSADAKRRQEIEAKDIQYITFWHNDFPDKQYVLYCSFVEEDTKKRKILCEWGVPIMTSTSGMIILCVESYGYRMKDGELIFYTSHEDLWKPLLFQRYGHELAECVAFTKVVEKKLTKEREQKYVWPKKSAEVGAEPFKENEEVYQQILDGTLTPADLQYIIDQM